MAEYSRIATGKVSSNGAATSVIIPFIPNSLFISNSTRASAGSGVTSAWWMSDMGQGASFLITTSGGSDLTSFISSGGFSTFSAGLSLQFGQKFAVSSITKANPAVVTTSSPHGLVSGNVVVFENLYETSSTGMQQIAGIPFVVTVTGATTFTIPWNTNQSAYTAIDGAATGSPTVMQVLYPNLYAPSVGFISALSLGATTTVTTTAPTNIQVGQEIAFRIPSVWGTVQLNSLPDPIIPGSPIYGYVQSVSSSTQFVVAINSAAFTAFNSNQPFGSFSGQSFPQVVPVGDINSGGNSYSGGALYPSPQFYNGFGTGIVSTINGPAILGAFANNTSMGFTIGASIAGTASDVIYWKAIMSDVNF